MTVHAEPTPRPRRWRKLGSGLAALALVAACGSDGSASSEGTGAAPTEAPSTTVPDSMVATAPPTTALDLEAAMEQWEEVADGLVADVVSDATLVAGELWAFSAAGESVAAWQWDGTAWGRDHEVPVAFPGAVRDLVTGDVTGDDELELLVAMMPNDSFGTVRTLEAGRWEVVPFVDEAGELVEYVEGPAIQGRDLVSYVNPCVPSCADGGLDEVIWEYDAERGAFVAGARRQVSPPADPSPPAPPPPPTTASPPPAPALSPGDPCALGSDRDCIDPDGDGQGEYLLGGGDCMASPVGGGLCSDLDGDGHAGYPDSG